MIRYIALLAVLVVLSIFFAFYPLSETRSQVANVNRLDCSNLANVNLDHPRYARCAALGNRWPNAANAAANMAANYVGDDYPESFTAELPTCKDQPGGPDAAHFYFLNAQDILDAADNSLVSGDDRHNWTKLRREAVRCLSKALSLDPSNRTYLLKRADVNDDDPLLAIKDLTRVIESQSDDTSLYLLRAAAYIKASQLKPALADYTKAISLEPKNTDPYLKRSLFFAVHMKDQEKALADLDSAIAIDPSEATALSRRADIYVTKKDYTNALKDMSMLIEKYPTYSFYFLSRAEIYEEAGQVSKALEDVNAAIKIFPNSYTSYQQRAKLYRKSGKIALAIKDESTAKRLKAKLEKELSSQ